MFLSQEYRCTERTVSDRGVLKLLYSFPHIGTGLNSAEYVRTFYALNALKHDGGCHRAVNNYSHKCVGKTRCKLFQGLSQAQLPGYRQTCSFHQDHWRWSEDKKDGPDASKKHKQTVKIVEISRFFSQNPNKNIMHLNAVILLYLLN